ncbi:DUF2059 domain-containing protein [Qipengyuania sp.]|uniref:DUF2059 domain-containing protein n=1 Tax=Qipengyuania sp. TaxID=2004515 RepID=UPI003AF587C4
MRISHALAATLLACAPLGAVSAQDYTPPAEEMVEAKAIIDAMFPPSTRDQQMRQMMSDIVKQMRTGVMQNPVFADPGMAKIASDFLESVPDALMPLVRQHFPDILEATATAYTREFSLDELKEIHAFAQTPAGQHYFSRATALLGDPAVARANETYMTAVHALQASETEKLRTKTLEYLKAHPEVVEKLRAPAAKK